MMRTASSSVSGSTVSTTRAPSVPCSVAHDEVVAQRSARRVAERARLVDHEAHPARDVAEAARRRRRPRARDARARRASSSSLGVTQVRFVVQLGEEPDRVGHRMVGRERLGQRPADVPLPAVLGVELEEVVVAAAEHRRPQRAHERELVARDRRPRAASSAGRGPRASPYTSELVSARYEMPASSSARSRKYSDVRAGSRMQTSPRRASRQPSLPSSTCQLVVDRGAHRGRDAHGLALRAPRRPAEPTCRADRRRAAARPARPARRRAGAPARSTRAASRRRAGSGGRTRG